jgi:hypothetical protein
MSQSNSNGGLRQRSGALRFAPFVRVRTEEQEKQGESLRTQRTQNVRDVALLNGTIVEWYGGREHATDGWEKRELVRLAADACKGKFDAVIIPHADRWDRGSDEAKAALAAFRQHRIRFFISTTEYDLFNPEHVLFLELSAAIGKFQAANQNKKSILNRIARAKRGIPTSGKLPFGRTWDKDNGWGINPKKQAMITEVARRYLAGESMPKMAREYGVNHANLLINLRERCGETWTIEFKYPRLNIHEQVTLQVPRLLDEEVIKAVHERLKANRTYLHRTPRPVYDYVLSGHIFCGGCGYLMTGQTATKRGNIRRYYRHAHAPRERQCPVDPKPWVRADKIEMAVLSDLFKMVGNPAAIERAVRAAIPDCDKELRRKAQLEGALTKVDKARDRILDLVTRDAITDAQAETRLRDLKDQEAELRQDLDKLASLLADVPDAEAVRCYVEQVQDTIGPAIFVYDDQGNTYAGGNDLASFLLMMDDKHAQDRRVLVEAVFSTPLADGTPAGVYIYPDGQAVPHRPKNWAFKVRGRLEFEFVMRNARQSPGT